MSREEILAELRSDLENARRGLTHTDAYQILSKEEFLALKAFADSFIGLVIELQRVSP